MGICGSKSDLKLDEVKITEKPTAPIESAAAINAPAKKPTAETAVGMAEKAPAGDGVAATSAEAIEHFKKSVKEGGAPRPMWGVAIAGGDDGAPWKMKVVQPQLSPAAAPANTAAEKSESRSRWEKSQRRWLRVL